MFDPTKFTSDGTILEVTFGKGPDTSKYMKYIKEGMMFNTYKVMVLDNRIYGPRNPGGYPESILATKIVNSKENDDGCNDDDIGFLEVIYPRDLIRTVKK